MSPSGLLRLAAPAAVESSSRPLKRSVVAPKKAVQMQSREVVPCLIIELRPGPQALNPKPCSAMGICA